MVENIQKRGKGEPESNRSHSTIHRPVVFICLCAHLPLRCLLSPPHHASSSHPTAMKALIVCDSAADCRRSLMGGFFIPGATLHTVILHHMTNICIPECPIRWLAFDWIKFLQPKDKTRCKRNHWYIRNFYQEFVYLGYKKNPWKIHLARCLLLCWPPSTSLLAFLFFFWVQKNHQTTKGSLYKLTKGWEHAEFHYM